MLPNKLWNQKKVRNKWALTLVALLLAVSVLSACGKNKEGAAADTSSPDSIVATYKDNGKITRAELDTFIRVNALFNPQLAPYMTDPAFQQDALRQLVTFRVLSSRIAEQAKAETDKQVAEQMKQIEDYLSKLEGGMDKQLKDNNLALKDIEDLMRMSFYMTTAVEGQITDADVKKAYDEQSAQHLFDIATVSHILVSLKDAATEKELRTKEEALTRAKEVLDKLNKGGDFGALAKEYSDDPGSKDNGGTYADADVNLWDPAFKQAAVTLPIGKISDPVESSFGYHVMKVEKRSAKPLEEVKEQIVKELSQTKLAEFAQTELPGLIETNNLPTPTPAPAASAEASPSASPAAE